MAILKEKKASIPVVIFVVGVLVLCMLALGIFLIKESGDKKAFEYGLISIQEIDFIAEDLKVAYDLGENEGFRKELRKIQEEYPKYSIRTDDKEIKITRIITNYELSWFARAQLIGESEKPGIIIERKVGLDEITGK